MKYRPFGKTEWLVSALGFGCMRFPTSDAGGIDEPESESMVKYAIERGVNYLDTAYVYHNGESELFLGKILQGRWREKVRLVTKLPTWEVKSFADFDRLLKEQLEKLQTDYLDVYLLHSLDEDSWEKMRRLDVQKWLQTVKSRGLVRCIGFSFHDRFEVFKEIVDGYDAWEVCQIQYNYMNEEYQAGLKGLQYAALKQLGVIIMEPLLGGKLASPPERISKLFNPQIRKITPAEWALQWLWNKPEVSIVLSGMSGMEQVIENITSADRSGVGTMKEGDLALVESVHKAFESIIPIPCTGCGYCLPCSTGVNIPRNLSGFNNGMIYEDLDAARQDYQSIKMEQGEHSIAEACVMCGECEPKCPQKIQISQWMQRVHAVLGKGEPYDPGNWL